MAIALRRDGDLDAKRLKALEEENRKLKKLLAELVLDVATLKEALGKNFWTPGSRRKAVIWAIEEKSYSQRRACSLLSIAPKVFRYLSRRGGDAAVRTRLRALAAERRRFGYRRLHILLRREGIMLNHKKLFRLYREERLVVRRRGGRKRALGTRAPMTLPQGPSQRWSLDFVSELDRPTAAAFGCLWWWTTSPANAWRWWWIHRCPVAGWCANSITS